MRANPGLRGKRPRARPVIAFLLLAVAACARQPECLLPSERPMVLAQLFFGRDIPGRAPLTDMEWSDFTARVIATEFPDGFTVIDGDGQWRDPGSNAIVREATKILLVAAPPSDALGGRLAAIIDAYRRRFDQQSVGLVTSNICAVF